MMKLFAHRGVIDYENTVRGTMEIYDKHPELGVEVDVRFATDRTVVLCHDREDRNKKENETLEDLLCAMENTNGTHKRRLMIDIKAFGVTGAKQLAGAVMRQLLEHGVYLKERCDVYLCSFNEYCVSELCFLREDMDLCWTKIGVITSGIPMGLFSHLGDIDFVSIDYSALCEDIMDGFAQTGVEVYAWVVNDNGMRHLMHRYGVHGMIHDVFENKNLK